MNFWYGFAVGGIFELIIGKIYEWYFKKSGDGK